LNIDLVVGDDRVLRPSVLDELHDTVLFESLQVLRNLLDVSIDQPGGLANTCGLFLCDRLEQVDRSRCKHLGQLVGGLEAQSARIALIWGIVGERLLECLGSALLDRTDWSQ
jgi:hypothetical protein